MAAAEGLSASPIILSHSKGAAESKPAVEISNVAMRNGETPELFVSGIY